MVIDGAAPANTPTAGSYIGALSLTEADWAMDWAYGIYDGNRAEPLWFE